MTVMIPVPSQQRKGSKRPYLHILVGNDGHHNNDDDDGEYQQQEEVPTQKKKCRAVSPINEKRVVFSSEPPQVRSRHVSEDDLKSSWLSKRELHSFRNDCLRILRQVVMRRRRDSNDSNSSSDEIECTRGLEILMHRVACGRASQRDVVRYIVKHHKMHCKLTKSQSSPSAVVVDPRLLLRDISMELSHSDRIRAQQLAFEDERESKSYYCC